MVCLRSLQGIQMNAHLLSYIGVRSKVTACHFNACKFSAGKWLSRPYFGFTRRSSVSVSPINNEFFLLLPLKASCFSCKVRGEVLVLAKLPPTSLGPCLLHKSLELMTGFPGEMVLLGMTVPFYEVITCVMWNYCPKILSLYWWFFFKIIFCSWW